MITLVLYLLRLFTFLCGGHRDLGPAEPFGRAEGHPLQPGSQEMGLAEVRPIEHGPAEIRIVQGGRAKACVAKIRTG